MTDDFGFHPQVGGGRAPSPKQRHGRTWRRHRDRGAYTWLFRRVTSKRYCPPTKKVTK